MTQDFSKMAEKLCYILDLDEKLTPHGYRLMVDRVTGALTESYRRGVEDAAEVANKVGEKYQRSLERHEAIDPEFVATASGQYRLGGYAAFEVASEIRRSLKTTGPRKESEER